MPLKFRDVAAGAKGGMYRYKNAEDGFVLEHPNVGELENRAIKYRRTNDYPVGVNWSEDFEANVCENTPPPTCIEAGPPNLAIRAANLAIALGRWASQGFPTRTTEEVEGIMLICKACEHYGGERGLLKIACRKCGCSRKKQSLRSEHCPIGKW